jgi:CRISPR-associated protein Csb3
MSLPQSTIKVAVDLSNPGQFFACCGLLELAHRLSPGAEGWFTDRSFGVVADGDAQLVSILNYLRSAEIRSDDAAADDSACPVRIGKPFDLRVDWWLDEFGVGAKLKTWSGRQKGLEMAQASKEAFSLMDPGSDFLNFSQVITIQKPGKRNVSREPVEPFCFDPRRGSNALRDGFSADALEMEVAAYPAVEFLAMVGLQRCRPQEVPNRRHTFVYSTWPFGLSPPVAGAAACRAIDLGGGNAFQFDLGYRDAAKRYKYFKFASKKETV